MTISPAELAAIVQQVRAVARAEIMPRFRTLAPDEVHAKSGPQDLVTVADERAEQALSDWLRQRFPGCAVVGEEAATRDPALLGHIATAPLCFVVDPVDGTSNFAAGLPLFGVIIAVVQAGVTTGAIIHDPVGDDTATALAGQGAWMEQPGGTRTRLRVAPSLPAAAMTGTVSWRYMPEPRRSQVCARLPRVAAAWDHRCAAHQYRMLAAGHCHFSVYNRLLPWDHAAGVLLHTEAGGYAALLDGRAPAPSITEGGMICAPDRAGWDALRAALFDAERPWRNDHAGAAPP